METHVDDPNRPSGVLIEARVDVPIRPAGAELSLVRVDVLIQPAVCVSLFFSFSFLLPGYDLLGT